MGKNMMDIVIVSNGRSTYLQNITKNAIETCKASSDLIDFNFIVVEQDIKAKYNIPGVTTFHYNFPFNYNRCLNFGINQGVSKYVALCNNDLDFKRHWAEEMILAMGDTYLSGSPGKRRLNAEPVEGYKVGTHVNGWCIVINRSIMNIIGELDTGVKFWYSDNIYADQLKHNNIKHILVSKSAVRHLTSLTLRVSRNARELMRKQQKNYIVAREKYNV